MDGTALAFRRRGDFLVVAVTNRPLDASHLAGVGRRVLGHICGPAFSLYFKSPVFFLPIFFLYKSILLVFMGILVYFRHLPNFTCFFLWHFIFLLFF